MKQQLTVATGDHRRSHCRTLSRSSLVVALALAFLLAGGRAHGDEPIDVKVLVLNFDPLIPSGGPAAGYVPLHEHLGWNDPRSLADGYAERVRDASRGFIDYEITQWRDVNDIPIKRDGFDYTVEQYLQNWQTQSGWHSPDEADYVAALNAHDVPALIDGGVVDEVWFFGGPYFGYWESAMAGPRSFRINGGTYPSVTTDRPFVVMGFNYERGFAEMLHDLGHRSEATLTRFFGRWNVWTPRTHWDHYTANCGQTRQGPYGVGTIHYPANGQHDYDYANAQVVESTAEDWLDYPELTGATASVSAADWGFSHEGYMQFWLSHLPKAQGVNEESGRMNNWWKYIYDFDNYELDGLPKGPRQGPGGNYYQFVEGPMSWSEALSDAHARVFMDTTGHLATITSQEEMDFVVALLDGREAWLAGSDADQDGTWRWMAGPEEGQIFWEDGVALGFSGFDHGEPNGGTAENYLHMVRGQWWDDVADTYLIGYLVEFEVVPEPSTLALLSIGAVALLAYTWRGSRRPARGSAVPSRASVCRTIRTPTVK